MLNVAQNTIIDPANINSILNKMIMKFTKNHIMSQKAHEEITAMIHSDKEIAEFFREYEIYITNSIVKILLNSGFRPDNLTERVHISLHLIDDLCHEIVYHKHEEINYNIMTDIVIKSVIDLLI